VSPRHTIGIIVGCGRCTCAPRVGEETPTAAVVFDRETGEPLVEYQFFAVERGEGAEARAVARVEEHSLAVHGLPALWEEGGAPT